MGDLATVRMVERRPRRGRKRDVIVVNAHEEHQWSDKYRRSGGIREPDQARYSVTTSDGRGKG